MYYFISSPQNGQVKRWKKLQTKKGRQTFGTYLIEGVHLLQEALKAQIAINAIIMVETFEKTNDLPLLEDLDIPIYQLPSSIFSQLAETKQSQGIMAEVTLPVWEWSTILAASKLILLLDEIQDPGNLGTIFRTASAAGVDCVVLGEGTVDPFNSKVIRSTQGALFHLPIREQSLMRTIEDCKRENFTIAGTSPHRGIYSYDFVFPEKVAIVLGNEARGIHDSIIDQLDQALMVPMPGVAESYNVSVTAGMLLYEWIRQQGAAT